MIKIQGIFLLLISGMFLISLLKTKKIDKFPIGSYLPNLTFESIRGKDHIGEDSLLATVIVWFHPECSHCEYQLNVIDRSMHRLDNTRFFLLTSDREYFKNFHHISWPNLVNAENVFFGIIDEIKFTKEFGPMVTPSLLIFNRLEELENKIQGEVRLEKMLNIIDNLKVPEHTINGHN